MPISRRNFLSGAAITAAFAALPRAAFAGCPFRVAVINDEISQDFDHACYVAAHDFSLQWIELRGMWNKNLTELSDNQLDEAAASFRSTSFASPTLPARSSRSIGPARRRQSRASIATSSMPTSISKSRTRCSSTASTSRKPSTPIASAASISGASKTSRHSARPSTTSSAKPPAAAQKTS